MNRHHLTHIDRAIARLLEERVRLVRGAPREAASPAIEDLLRRLDGEVSAGAFRAVFEAIDAACASPDVPSVSSGSARGTT
jgi:hypothetical protein